VTQEPVVPAGRARREGEVPAALSPWRDTFAVARFCTVCGEWFDQAVTAAHCERPRTAPLPDPVALPRGDHGTVWAVPGHIEAARVAYRREPRKSEPRIHPTYVYNEALPESAGYFVYRLWDDGGCCLYVGMVGLTGPAS
jgi:hypothetical protein